MELVVGIWAQKNADRLHFLKDFVTCIKHWMIKIALFDLPLKVSLNLMHTCHSNRTQEKVIQHRFFVHPPKKGGFYLLFSQSQAQYDYLKLID